MAQLQASQIKAARAMLDWTREDLAAATGLALNTIRNLESGMISPRHATNIIIRQVIEAKGIEFTEHEGVRRRPTDLLLYRGFESSDLFFNDLLHTARQSEGAILAVCAAPAALLEAIGATDRNIERLEELSAQNAVKCLLWQGREAPFVLPSVQFRAVSKLQACPSGYFVYGDRLAFVMREGGSDLRFVIVQSLTTARHWSAHFLDLWQDAVPLASAGNAILDGDRAA